MRSSRIGALFVFLALWVATAAWGEVAVPPLKARVTDLTGTLTSAQRSELESELQNIEARSSSQVAVLMLPTTQPEAIEQYSIRVAEDWKLGQKGVDNGVLILVAKDDRKMRIEVGYGLEGFIPDAIAKRIVDDTIAPHFKQGDFAGGLMAGVKQIEAAMEGRPLDTSGNEGKPTTQESPWFRGIPEVSLNSVTDLTNTLSYDQIYAWGRELNDFYDSGKDFYDIGRAKPAYVLVVPTIKPESIEGFADTVMNVWRERDNLDTDRTILLVIARDEGKAYVAAGQGLGSHILPGDREKLVAQIEPMLRQGDLAGAVGTGVHGIDQIIDRAASNKTTGERVSEYLMSLPMGLIVAIVLIGEVLRWFLRPLLGASVMAGVVSTGAWLVSGYDIASAVIAAIVTFIVVLVGLLNWLMLFLEGAASGGGGGGSSGGGFSGGGGSFGGGGASGSW